MNATVRVRQHDSEPEAWRRVVQTVNETDALELAQGETEAMLDRTQLRELLEMPEGIWGHTRF